MIAIVLTVVVFADLALSGHAMVKPLFSEVRRAHLEKVSLDSYYDPRGASKYLLGLQTEQPFRYFGYGSNPRNFRLPYTQRFYEAGRIAIEVNNRAIMTGLKDVQGYNPTHVARYDEFIMALNRRGQDYHDSEIFVRGLSSPLLPLLNARTCWSPRSFCRDTAICPPLSRASRPSTTTDGYACWRTRTRCRAWLVHSARRLERGAALKLLASGQVNLRETVLLEAAPPTLAPPRDLAQESVVYEDNTADGARLRVRTTAPAMLVLSEVYTPQWRAYVDGRPAPVYVANHAFRAVAVPTGEHIVELRYESPALALGLAISGVGYAALAGWSWLRRGRGDGGGRVHRTRRLSGPGIGCRAAPS
ncbi:MAG: YfhO family protein [Chloroflexia bacterium]